MEQPSSFKLVDGVFTASEAEEVINALISSKINYHSMQDLRNYEQSGTDIAHSKKRIDALKEMKLSIKKVLDLAEEKGLKVKMDGLIDITILE
jgi:hypothetical protein